jgi:hypothetical protein
MAAVAFGAGMVVNHEIRVQAQGNQIYELRTYTAAPGKHQALLDRFGGGEIEIFHKHGMKSVGYWVPEEAPLSGTTMIYMLSHDSRQAARESWQGFGGDPEWHAMRDASEVDGRLTANVESIFLNPTDFSPAK